jgi:N6-L-threonylcarbamoyladenine synthase
VVTLGIETSCDETAAAVVQNGKVLSSIVSSSVPLHEKYGGVIPEIASRFHIEYINQVTKKALKRARKTLSELDLVAVTDVPGLPGCLLAGLAFAKALAYSTRARLVNVNHLHAHIYANFLGKGALSQKFPFLGVVVSGGHTNIFICRSFRDLEVIGRTRDDAIGEAFDKVARILDIGYPGGPKIEKHARKFRGLKPIDFPRALLDAASFDFSLSGIKTAVFYYVKKNRINRREISRIAWSFQEAVFDVLNERITRACRKFAINRVFLGGGVIANARLRAKLRRACEGSGYRVFYPPPALCADNAAMVAGLGEKLGGKG